MGRVEPPLDSAVPNPEKCTGPNGKVGRVAWKMQRQSLIKTAKKRKRETLKHKYEERRREDERQSERQEMIRE